MAADTREAAAQTVLPMTDNSTQTMTYAELKAKWAQETDHTFQRIQRYISKTIADWKAREHGQEPRTMGRVSITPARRPKP
jgi:hypothetical protein